MSKILFPPELVEELNANPNVKVATERYIQFSEHFKVYAVDDFLAGKPRRQIFEEAGFDVDAIGENRIRYALGNWLKKHRQDKDVRSAGRGKQIRRELTDAERIARLEAKVEMLRQENDFLRQIRRLERRHQPSKSPSERNTK